MQNANNIGYSKRYVIKMFFSSLIGYQVPALKILKYVTLSIATLLTIIIIHPFVNVMIDHMSSFPNIK